MSEARTMSNSPAFRATTAMISSGALPKVALSSPPTASPVREAICSVAATMSEAIGIMATHAAKKNPCVGLRHRVLEGDHYGNKDEKPVNFHGLLPVDDA